MPKRLYNLSRTEPARTILLLVGFLTVLGQALALGLTFNPDLAINSLIVAPLGIWAVYASAKNKLKQMALASFWLFVVWFWSGTARLVFMDGRLEFIWFPFLTVAICLGVVYIYLNGMHRQMKEGGINR